ncbi:unnamed protein product [Rotaria sp. Silwood1]|nr:unnamed protein product [Rotaria sp. Silwood1]
MPRKCLTSSLSEESVSRILAIGQELDHYWHIMSEHYCKKLDNAARENKQLHELYDQLLQEREQLQANILRNANF